MSDEFPDVPGGAHLRTVAMPRDANASGDIFGGWTLSQMDTADATSATRTPPSERKRDFSGNQVACRADE